MKWRCPQCGKPQERNDPPCDNCGHHKFERAVVPQPEADDSREQFVWACSDCGRHHQRNNPPCSRCGGTTFEKKPLEYDDLETSGDTPGYLELVGRQELTALGVVLGLVIVGVLGFLGVFQIPGITPQPPPSVENPPGDAEQLGSIALSDVEAGVLSDVDEQRSGSGLQELEELDPVATYVAQQFAADLVAGRELSVTGQEIERFDTPCSGPPAIALWGSQAPLSGSSLEEIVGVVDLQTITRDAPSLTDSAVNRIGIDAHALPDGGLIVAAAYC